jgi:hypothetical protein
MPFSWFSFFGAYFGALIEEKSAFEELQGFPWSSFIILHASTFVKLRLNQ